jgi:hypothetical protein
VPKYTIYDYDGARTCGMLRKLAKKFPPIVRLYRLYTRYWKPLKIAKDYLTPLGYFNRTPSDLGGEPLPWFSYPAILFLESVIQNQWKVFEYGTGYSTVFWNRKCAKTVSIEHSEYWFDFLRKSTQDFEVHLVKEGTNRQRQVITDLIGSFEAMNFELPVSRDQAHNMEHGLLNIEFADYAAKLIDFPKCFFDVIVVDGMARSLCLFIAADYISESGIIILDNSDRWQYNDTQNYLICKKGFKRLDFHGLGPVNTIGWTTSIFFKNTGFLQHTKCKREQGAGDLGW